MVGFRFFGLQVAFFSFFTKSSHSGEREIKLVLVYLPLLCFKKSILLIYFGCAGSSLVHIGFL